MNKRITLPEFIILALVILFTGAGMILLYTNLPAFEWYTREDKLVEWLTVFGLLAASFVCLKRVFQLYGVKPVLFTVVTALLGLFFFFGAGEEISWGQRIFDIQSSDYFKQHNSQGETNIHNLVLGGVRLNRWIFSFFLATVMMVYIIVVPLLYRKKRWMQSFVDRAGIPLPKPYQVIFFLLLFISTQLLYHEKKAELLEMGAGFLIWLIVAFPMNKISFQKQSRLN